MEEKIDKDLRVTGEVKFEIDFIEDEKGNISHNTKASTDDASAMVMYATIGEHMRGVIENNKNEPDKRKRLSVADVRTHVAMMRLCQSVASQLGAIVYQKGMHPETKDKRAEAITIEPAMNSTKLKRVD